MSTLVGLKTGIFINSYLVFKTYYVQTLPPKILTYREVYHNFGVGINLSSIVVSFQIPSPVCKVKYKRDAFRRNSSKLF